MGIDQANDSSVFLRTIDRMEKIELDEILYFKADRNYCNLFFVDKEKRPKCICKPLAHITDKQELDGFVRVHRSYIINKRYAEGYRRGKFPVVYLKGNVEIPLSNRLLDCVEALLR